MRPPHPNLTGVLPFAAEDAIRKIYDYVYQLHAKIDAIPSVPSPYGASSASGTSVPTVQTIQATGASPVNVQGLLGLLAQPQLAQVPKYSTLSAVPNPQDGLIVSVGNVLYRYNATSTPGTWEVLSTLGVFIQDTRANIVNYPAANYPAGSVYYQTDTLLFYQSTGAAWVYGWGTWKRTQAQAFLLNASLGVDDTNLLVEVTDFFHVLQWTGAAFQWGPGDTRGGYIQGFFADPSPTTGWALCNGAASSILNSDATATNVTTPNLTATPSFLKFDIVVGPSAAIAPWLAMDSYTPAGTISTPMLTMNSYTPAGTVSQPTFTGNALGTHQHEAPQAVDVTVGHVGALLYDAPFGTSGTQTLNYRAAAAATGLGISTALDLTSAVSAGTPSGTVSQPTFTGTAATLTGSISTPTFTGTAATLTGNISDTGEPTSYHLRPWLRR